MSNEVKVKRVEEVASLAALRLQADEVSIFQGVFENTLKHFAKLQELDVEGVEPLYHPVELDSELRPDQATPQQNSDLLLNQAPDVQDRQFKVPPVVS